MAFEPNWMTPEELIDDYLKRKAYAPAPPTGTSQEELTTGLLDNDIGNAIAEINKATELLKPPSQQVQIAPEQTEFNAKNKIDQGVIDQATGNGQPLQTPQTSFQVPNPLYYQDMNSIAGLKALNELAGEGTEGDAIRDWTHKQADLIRERAAATGKYDLSQFGVNNATARDTVQQIESQRARDILEATMPDGKYYRTADQYYRDAYYDNLALGYSPRQARKFAANRAREYQADRVGYLDAVYNSHGRDGYLTTPEGAQILAQLAQENPMLANFYGQVYSLPKDEYSRQSRLTEEAVKNNYQLGLLGAGLNNDIAKAYVQYTLNELGKNNDVPRYRQKEEIETQELIKRYQAEAGIDFSKFQNQENFKAKLEKQKPSEIAKIYNEFAEAAKLQGYSDEEARSIAADLTGMYVMGKIKLPSNSQPAKGESSQSKPSDVKDRAKYIEDQIKALREQDPDGQDPKIQEKIQHLETRRKEVEKHWDETLGETGTMPTFQSGVENESANIALANKIRESFAGKYTNEQISQMIYRRVMKDTNDKELEAVGKWDLSAPSRRVNDFYV